MDCIYIKEDKLLILEITEEVDHHLAEKIRRRADYEIQRHMPKKIVFDFTHVNLMDSAGIGMIIGRYKMATMFGACVVIRNASKSVAKILEMSGILKIIPMEENKQAVS